MTFGSHHIPTPLSRRHFLRALTAASLLRSAARLRAEPAPSLQITVANDNWGKASPADIRAVVASAAGELWKCAGQTRLKSIRVYRRADHPQTDFSHDILGRIRIGLAAEDSHWAQFAFQFGHEFCHVLAQHSDIAKRGWHTPQHANLWFEESLCETASLFVLKRMADTWTAQPPNPEWRSYAPSLAAYATERLARPEHQLPAGQKFTEWFRENEPALRANAALREKSVIIATQLLLLFEAEPARWEAACYLNLGKHDRDKSLVQYFGEWQAATPVGRKAFVAKVAALFGASRVVEPRV